ncbi:MAG: response regulator, partial [bacterium]|nr:response regulator [bacterium]
DKKTDKEKPLVLVVEDNDDVRSYIKSSLEDYFKVAEAADGKAGIFRAKEIMPDLVISDVMMPGTDGYELSATLKKDILTSHIPIILLTSRVSEESVIKGLETGADDYITKPFSTQLLAVRVRNLIHLRRQLQNEQKSRMTLQPGEISVLPIDDEFYKKLQETVETHLADPDFNVEALSRILEMSQATLYRKIQALTGKTPTDFIRSYRVKRAAQFLQAREGTISEAADRVGFPDRSYFAKCFKDQFQRLPSDFLSPGTGIGVEVNANGGAHLDEEIPPETANAGETRNGKEVILVVEDSNDSRAYIRESLETDYQVEEAVDGAQGVEKAIGIIPDLIVSDISMPGATSGLELCRLLKKDLRTSHIPIVLLTAKATEDNVIEGLQIGADDYITKPFNTRILHTRIKNLIRLRNHLQQRREREMTLLPARISESRIDRKFMNRLNSIIDKNLSESEFNVENLAKKLSMSAATLYRKLQALTGEIPSQYIRSYRLRRAAHLLKTGFGSVTEVAFEVGFSSRAYFTRCFKEKFHQLPSGYINETK